MKLDLRFKSLDSVCTDAVSALEATSSVSTHHVRLGLRPPKGIYNLSLHQVVDRFSMVVQKLGTLPSMNDREKSADAVRRDFLHSLDALLDALVEHIEDCNSVIKCFFSSDDDKSYKAIFQAFRAEVRPYRDHIAKLVNKVKHNQGRLRFLYHQSIFGKSFGYFVEAADRNGVIGPDGDIHANGDTAFSIPRDLRYHICGVFFVAERLAHAIRKATGLEEFNAAPGDVALGELIRSVSSIAPVFFPDEIKAPYPAIKIESEACRLSLGKENIESAKAPLTATISVSFVADGVSNAYRVPYMQRGYKQAK